VGRICEDIRSEEATLAIDLIRSEANRPMQKTPRRCFWKGEQNQWARRGPVSMPKTLDNCIDTLYHWEQPYLRGP
jgi:hypothetical protein